MSKPWRSIESMSPDELRAEVDFWRQDAAASLWSQRITADAAEKEGEQRLASHLRANVIMPGRAALAAALAGELHDFSCEACGKPIEDGQRVFHDADCGYLHADCLGEVTSAEGFVDADGEPLPPDAPIPQPEVYERIYTPEKIAAELAATDAWLHAEDDEIVE